MNRIKDSRSSVPVTIVVGGVHGIGKNIAYMFHRDGHKVIVVDKQAPLDNQDNCFCHLSIHADLVKNDSVLAAIRQISDCVPYISNLVFSTRYRGSKETAWKNEIALGVTSTKMMVEKLSHMMEGISGSIVLISSTAARLVTPGCTLAYHAVKATIEQMTRYYAVMLGPKQIRVNAVAPGYIVKDESLARFRSDPKRITDVENMHPLRRYGRADDVAGVVFFLCSEAASFITGRIITVDGGLSLHNPGF